MVGKLFNYVRGRTWIAVPFISQKVAELLGRAQEDGNCVLPFIPSYVGDWYDYCIFQIPSQRLRRRLFRIRCSTKGFVMR